MRQLTVCLMMLLATAFAADKGLAGKYAGEWKSAGSGNGGTLHFTLEGPEKGTWKCEVTFSLDGNDVKTIMREVKVQEADAKVEFAYDFDVQGATVRSHLTGDWDGASFKGKYQSTLPDGSQVDAGTWTAVRELK